MNMSSRSLKSNDLSDTITRQQLRGYLTEIIIIIIIIIINYFAQSGNKNRK